jgi:hypothetical protein
LERILRKIEKFCGTFGFSAEDLDFLQKIGKFCGTTETSAEQRKLLRITPWDVYKKPASLEATGFGKLNTLLKESIPVLSKSDSWIKKLADQHPRSKTLQGPR